jgi:hypothetical protein
VALDPVALYRYREFLRPDEDAVRYYPAPTENDEYLSTYRGESKLRRMETSFPRPITITGEEAGATTAQEWTEFVFTRFAEQYPWFTFESVPDIRYPDGGTPQAEALLIPQIMPNRLSMLDVAKQVVTPFAILRQNAAGNIEVIPRWGPDAPKFPAVELELEDVESISTSKPDPTSSVNAATVTQSGYGFVAGQEVMQQACMFLFSGNFFSDLDPAWRCGNSYVQMGDWPASQVVAGTAAPQWPVAEGVLLSTDKRVIIDLQVEGFTNHISGSSRSNFTAEGTVWSSNYQQVALANPASAGATTLDVAPLSLPIEQGQWIQFDKADLFVTAAASAGATTVQVQAVPVALESGDTAVTSRAAIFANGQNNSVATIYWTKTGLMFGASATGGFILTGQYRPELGVIQFGFAQAVMRATPSGGTLIIANYDVEFHFRLSMAGYGRAFVSTGKTITGTFGLNANDALPAFGGGNLVAISQANYGVRERQINLEVYQLTAEEAVRIARNFVEANINPRVRRTVRQSLRNRYPVQFDHVGRLVSVPNGELALVEGRSYSDAFTPEGGSMDSTFRYVAVDYSQPVLDPAGCYLYGEDGAVLYGEGGEPLEPEAPCDIPPILVPPGELPSVTVPDTSLEGREDWNNDLRGGTPMTTQQLAWHTLVIQHFANGIYYGEQQAVPYASWSGRRDAYQIGRVLWMTVGRPAKQLFRVTGDLRLLSYVTRLMNYSYALLRIGWDGTVSPPASGPSPYLNWGSYGGNQPDSLVGTDLERSNESKCWLAVSELADWLNQNRGKACPLGLVNYSAEADKWTDLSLNHFLPKWRGGTGGWRAEYRARERRDGSGRDRCTASEHVVMRHSGMHTYMGMATLLRYLHKLTNDSAWMTACEDELDFALAEHKLVAGSRGNNRFWARVLGQMVGTGSPNYHAHPATYFPYTFADWVDLWFEGVPAATSTRLTEIARAFEEWTLETQGTKRDLQGGMARGGIPASATSWSGTTRWQLTFRPVGIITPWDDSPGQRIKAAVQGAVTQFGNRAPAGPVSLILSEVL